MFNDKVEQLDPVVAKRARHVITENERTLQAADALSAGDLKRMYDRRWFWWLYCRAGSAIIG